MLIPVFYVLSNENRFKIGNISAVTFAVLLVHVYSMYIKTGDWLLLVNSRRPWFGNSESFVGSFVNFFLNINIYGVFEVLVIGLFVGALALTYKSIENVISKNLLLAFLVAYLLMAVVNGGFTGMFKYLFILLPFYLSFGVVLASRPKVKMALFFVLFFIGTIFMALWSISSPLVI